MRYEGTIYRPPSEARSYLLQATIGCSWNHCTYCAMYPDGSYRVRDLEETLEDIRMAREALGPAVRKVFVCDGDALVMDLDLLGPGGMISLDDFVLDWAGGFAFDAPDHAVGFTQRSGVMTPGDFEWVATPRPRRAASLMIRDFVALAEDPAGAQTDTSIAVSEQTQGLLDAVWKALS